MVSVISPYTKTEPNLSRSSTFEALTSRLASKFRAQWLNTPGDVAPFGETVSPRDQREMERKVRDVMKDYGGDFRKCRRDTARMQQLKASVKTLVVRSTKPSHQEQVEDMLDEFSKVGDEFVRRAETYDPGISAEDIFQALRNMWIVNSMQVAFGLPVCLTDSSFAYSMLYPYTDNFLDDAAVDEREKREFNAMLDRRLAGFEARCSSTLAQKVSDLVAMIESEYPRDVSPWVYESLRAIHRSQQESLAQHRTCESLSLKELLGISVEKGGSSVLADAALAKGWLSLPEAEFAYGYGVFLQFMDDQQDVASDKRKGHQTIFASDVTGAPLDGTANRLARFTGDVLDSCSVLSAPSARALNDLIRKSCSNLMLESIALNPQFYSPEYINAVEKFSPLRFEAVRELQAHVENFREAHREEVSAATLPQIRLVR